jgi:hypothetical protein
VLYLHVLAIEAPVTARLTPPLAAAKAAAAPIVIIAAAAALTKVTREFLRLINRT